MKTLKLAGGLLLAALIAGIYTGRVHARLTGTDPGTDLFCIGPSGAEMCVNASGSVIPTTTNVSDLGTAALKFAHLYVTTGGISAGSVDTATLAADSVTASKILNGSVNTAKIAPNSVDTSKFKGATSMPNGAALCALSGGGIGYCSTTPTNGLCTCN